MLTRTPLRVQRAVRAKTYGLLQRQSTASSSSAGAGQALTGGLVGGTVVLFAVYGWYHISGTKSAVQAAKQTKKYIDSATESLKVKFDEQTPTTDQALKTLRDAANKYAVFIPGARQWVDAVFDDLSAVRQKHGREVDNIVQEAYGELRDASAKGMNMQAAGEVYSILIKHFESLLGLGKDAAEDILNNHPQMKEKLGGSADQLRQLGERLGPQAKQEIDEAWKQINELMQQGLQVDSIVKAQNILREKIQKLREMGEKAFDQGWEQLQPLLEKNPKMKEIVEENKDTLKQGNVSETIGHIKEAVQGGDLQKLQRYIDKVKNGAGAFKSSQVSNWLERIPDGSEILSQLQNFRQIAEEKGEEGEKLAKATVDEIKQVLDGKMKEAEKLADSVKQETER